MGGALFVIGLLAFLACIVLLFINLIRKKPYKRWGLGMIISFVVFIIGIATLPSSEHAMTFETIGTKGSTVLITLVSPSPDTVSPEDLANRLREDWQYQLNLNENPNYHNQVHVMVFDNNDAPQRWLEIWDISLDMSDQEWVKEQARIFPHRVANYDRNKTTGLHQVEILSRAASGSIVRTIKF